jgi:hypothetical protein
MAVTMPRMRQAKAALVARFDDVGAAVVRMPVRP